MKKVAVTVAALSLIAAACGGGGQAQQQTPPSSAGPQRVEVTAVDYAFEGVPATIEAGEVTFALTNKGEVRHELGFAQLIGEKSVEEVVQLPESQLAGEVERMEEGVRPIAAGATGEVTIELEPGRYAYVCFVAAGTGAPHAFEGMAGEFIVE